MVLPPVKVRRNIQPKISTQVTLSKANLMAKVNISTRMAIDMSVSGNRTLDKEKENFSMPTEILMMVIGMLTRE